VKDREGGTRRRGRRRRGEERRLVWVLSGALERRLGSAAYSKTSSCRVGLFRH